MSTDTLTIHSINVPKVGLGTYQLTGSEAVQKIEDALHLGYRHIDTARMYGNEKEVGKAVKNSGIERQHIFLTTKIWPEDFKKLLEKTQDSLYQLHTDYVDLLLLHWPGSDEENKAAVDLLHQALHKGYAKNIGVSNFNLEQWRKAMEQAPVICNQVEYHPFLSQEKMLAFAKQYNMFLTAYSPLAVGKAAKDKTLLELGKKFNKSASQVTLRWLVQQDVVVIPKASSKERLKENLSIFDFEISDEDMKTIYSISSGERLRNPPWAPLWD